MTDDLYTPQLSAYLDDLVPEREAELQAMEAYAKKTGFPIIGPASGYFCYQLARIAGARRIFEMGSGFGYSTAWFARALRENGGEAVHHVVWDAGLSAVAREHLDRLGYSDLVQYHVGEAVQTLQETPGPFDLIFNDIDKEGYPASLSVIAEKLRPGGLLIIDNMLWHGRIFDAQDQAPSTAGVREVTRLLAESKDWVTTLMPIRDGLLLAFRL